MNSESFCLVAACGFGLESLVKRELSDLGYEPRIVSSGRVEFAGDAAAIARANLWLRTPDRVYVKIAEFAAPDFDSLFDAVREVEWETWIAPDAAIPVSGKSRDSQLTSVPACQRTVKKGIVERLLARPGVFELPESGPPVGVELELVSNRAQLLLDTTGAGLHRRGYRTYSREAPLRENLAAALVLLSRWRHDLPLLDPFCGSGVIPLEAALIGRNLAPGRLRTFDAEAWPCLKSSVWKQAREEAEDLAKRNRPLDIVGADRDAAAIHVAGRNRTQAGVSKGIRFIEREFADFQPHGEYGVLIANLPYGLRMGEAEEIAALHREIPHVLRRAPTWSHHLLTADANFEKEIGQMASRRRKLYNGRIACTLYSFHGPRPPKPSQGPHPTKVDDSAEADVLGGETPASPPRPIVEAAPAFGAVSARDRTIAEEFGGRLAKAARHFRRWPTKQGITCYRLYERDVPGAPLGVDVYEDHLLVSEFERPSQRTPAEQAAFLDLLIDEASRRLGIPSEKIVRKVRRRRRGREQYEKESNSGETMIAHEGGLKFIVNLRDYLDVGLFLDHRQTRAMVRDEAAGRRVLNLFCYTGAFTVYAAAGGAESTTSVDLSATYLEWTRRNLEVNNFRGPQHRLIQADCREYLMSLPRGDHFDLAVVDAPTFSNSKRTDQDWDVQRGHVELVQLVAQHLSPDGKIYFSSNARRFEPHWDAAPELVAHEITRQTVPPDFRDRRPHRCWIVRRRAE